METQTKISTTQLSSGFENKMDLLSFMLNFFNLTFVGPADKIAEIVWKRKLYNAFQLIILISYIPAFVGNALGLYKFRENLEVVTNILVTGLPLISGFIAGLYFFIHWEEIKTFIDSIESKSGFAHTFVYSKNNLLEIVEDTKRKCIFLTQVVATVEFIGLTTFFLKPFLLDYLEKEDLNLTEEEHKTEQWKKMIYIIWLPVDPTQPTVFYVIYVFQLFTSLAFYCHSASTITFIVVCARYAAAQFRIVKAAIAEVDVLATPSKFKKEIDIELEGNGLVNEQKFVTESKSLLGDLTDECIYESILEDEEMSSNEVDIYIRECIRIHQSAIRFAMDLNDLLSPVISMYLLILTVVLITATFQLAVGDGFEKDFPYVCVVLVVSTDLFGLCWHGQELINESFAVEHAVYNILWYNHSSSVKYLVKFIIFRAQKVVELTGSGFINLSIDTYSAVLNFSYQWFTLLLNMYDE